MKYAGLIFMLLILSCTEKNKSDCYTCKTTYNIMTDVPIDGYPATTTTEVELCDITSEQATTFEQTNKGSESTLVGNVTYSSHYSTQCTHN